MPAGHFSAGVAMLDAFYAVWGQPDRMLEALRLGLADFERVIYNAWAERLACSHARPRESGRNRCPF